MEYKSTANVNGDKKRIYTGIDIGIISSDGRNTDPKFYKQKILYFMRQ